jgi:hypothetical protein
MNDLPVFVQMFVRLFALIAIGFWLQVMAGSQPEEKKPAEAKPAVQKAESTGATVAQPCADPAAKCSLPRAKR